MEQLTIRPPGAPLFGAGGEHHFREQASLRPLRRHSLIYAPGDDASHLYLVADGEVKISRYTAEGRELTLDHLGPGEVFGETEILLGRARESQALARCDGLLYAMERATMFTLAEEQPGFGLWLTQMLSERQARMECRLETLLFKSANGKVAQVLLKLAEVHGEPTAAGTLINYPITHQEIGSLIATTRETVSYAFMEFRQRGLISTRQRRTIVHDLDELGEVALA